MNTFFKSAAVASAIALTSTVALADNSFGLQESVDDGIFVMLDLVNSETDGTVVIYDYTNDEFGEVLGMASVNEGANTDVNISIGNNIAQRYAAVLYNGPAATPDMSAAWIELEIDEES